MLGTKIINFLKCHKKTFLYVAFFVAVYFFFTDFSFADGPGDAQATPDDSNPAEWFNAFVQVISTGIGMLTNVVGLFLNPGWTNATGIGLHIHLKELWIMISNIVYVIFAFLLIVIAFMNIIGKGDKWELKQALPRFVIGVLIVPFSWLFVQLLIAFSSFLSVSVLMLPYEVLSNSPTSSWSELSKKDVCTNYVVVSAKSDKTDSDKDLAPGFCGDTKKIGDLMSSNGVYGMLNIYTFGIFSLDRLSEIDGKEVDTLTSIFKVGINGIVVLLLAIVYFILIVSLCLALFVRGVWLWLYMIFSPVFGLLYFFDKGKDGFIEGKFSISEFISLAMVPVYVSAALAFGLLFIFVSGSAFTGQGETSGFLQFNNLNKGENTVDAGYTTGSTAELDSVKSLTGSRITLLKDFKLDMYGDFGTSGKNAEGVFDVMKSGFGTLFMQLFGLAVLWIAVMAAINQSKITQAVVEPIAAFGKQVGGLIQKAPQYAPVFPGGQSMTSLKNASSTYAGSFQTAQSNKGAELAGKLPFSQMSDKSQKLVTLGNKRVGSLDEVIPILDDLRSQGSFDEMVSNGHAVDAIKKQLKQYVDKGGVKNKDKSLEMINKIKLNDVNSMREAWEHIEGDAANATKSVLAGTKRVTAAEVDDYFGSNATKSNNRSKIKDVLTVEDVQSNKENIDSYRLGTILIDVNKDGFADTGDYKKIAIELADTNMVGSIKRKDFDKAMDRMGISDSEKKEKIYKEISEYIYKDDETGEISYVNKGEGNIDVEDMFNNSDE